MKMGADFSKTQKVHLSDHLRSQEHFFHHSPEPFKTFPFRSFELRPPDNMTTGSKHEITGKSDISHLIEATVRITGDPAVLILRTSHFGANRTALAHGFSGMIELNGFPTV
jgi:hypothetical protein